MTDHARTVGVLGSLIFGPEQLGKTITRYREFQLGADLASISLLTGVPAPHVKTHASTALVQDLEWPDPYAGSADASCAGVQHITFSFYNDQLFRVLIRYRRDQSATMTDAYMAQRVSAMYGRPVTSLLPSIGARVGRSDVDWSARLATWSDGHHTAVLYGPSRMSGFRIVVNSVRLHVLARAAVKSTD